MIRFVARRLAMLVAALVVSSFVTFAAVSLAPGDPVAALTHGRALPPDAVAQLRTEYHLDEPLLTRYFLWLGDVLHGDLGTSQVHHESVLTMIGDRIGVTVQLVAFAGIIIIVVGLGMGIAAGLGPSWLNTITVVVTSFFAAIPSFVTAMVLLSVFAVNLAWFPTRGQGEGLIGRVEHLTLPAIALALASIAIVARLTRVSVKAELGSDHIETAISRGIPYRNYVRRHVLRNASISITTVVGLTITALFALSAVIEQVFGLQGIGAALVSGAQSKDLPVVQGVSLVIVTAFVVGNAAVDLVHALLDPRVTLEGDAR